MARLDALIGGTDALSILRFLRGLPPLHGGSRKGANCLSLPPDYTLGVSPRRAAVDGAVEDTEGQVYAQLRHPLGGLLLLLEEGVGDEVGHL